MRRFALAGYLLFDYLSKYNFRIGHDTPTTCRIAFRFFSINAKILGDPRVVRDIIGA
jgi:hypothetical protein